MTAASLRRLKERESCYRHLFECAADAQLLIDARTWRVEDANEAATLLYGYSRGEFRGMEAARLSAEPEATRDMLARLSAGIGRGEGHRVHRRHDGMEFPVEIRSSSFETEGRRLIIASIRDLAEPTRARLALEESELRFRQMAESISQVFWMTDPQKKAILYVSPAYESIWGRACAGLYADPRSWLDAVHPEDRERVRAALPRQTSGTYDECYRIVRPDGGVRWVRDRAFPVRDGAGGVIRVTGVAQDVTETKRAEDSMKEARELLEEAQEVAGVGSWMYDIASGTCQWSAQCCRIFGVDPARPYDCEDFYRLLHPEDRPKARQAEADALRLGRYELEYRVAVGGRTRLLHSRASVQRDAEGRPLKLIGVIQDVTEARESQRRLAETERQLQQAQKMEAVGRLAGGVAHDFNNILTAILGLAELGAASLPREAPLRADIEEIRACALRAANLTQQLLAFSRRQIIAPRLVALDDMVLGLGRMLGRVIGEHISLRVAPAAAGARLMVDPGQVEQLLMNLAVNSRDAMPEGGTLQIATARARVESAEAAELGVTPGDYLVISVADDGQGMSEEVRSHIFEPFFTTKEQGKGTGLGLATCYGIVKQNHGAIACESAPGQGTRFRIYLPECRSDAPLAGSERRAAMPRGTERVLIVEDEEPVRRLAQRVLKQLGYDPVVAADGDAAVRLAREDARREIRLVLTDMLMPRMGGRKLAQTLAAERPDLPVLFTTGYTDDTIEAPSDLQLLRKPFTGSQLAARVRACLDARAS